MENSHTEFVIGVLWKSKLSKPQIRIQARIELKTSDTDLSVSMLWARGILHGLLLLPCLSPIKSGTKRVCNLSHKLPPIFDRIPTALKSPSLVLLL